MLSIIIQGPVTNNYIREFEKLERLLSFATIELIWCTTEIPPKTQMSNNSSLQLFSVPDCGAIPVITPPHFTNTNRMFLTTCSAFAQINTKSEYVLKLRSDLKITNEKLFLDFIEKLLSTPRGVLVCVAQANHDWELPFNLADWCFGGETNTVKTQVQRVKQVSPELGKCRDKTLNDFLFGYVKKGYSPKYTTEQILGAMMFNIDLAEINTYASSKSWSCIKSKKLLKYSLQDSGLASSKHHLVSQRKKISYPFLLNLLLTLGKNIIRSIL